MWKPLPQIIAYDNTNLTLNFKRITSENNNRHVSKPLTPSESDSDFDDEIVLDFTSDSLSTSDPFNLTRVEREILESKKIVKFFTKVYKKSKWD